MGDPIVFVLALIGLFRKAWTPRRLLYEIILLTMVTSILILLFTAQHIESRYVFPLIPLMIIWSSKGIAELAQWVHPLVAALKLPWAPISSLFGIGIQAAAFASIVFLAFYGSRSLFEFTIEQRGQLPMKEASLWLRHYKPPAKTNRHLGLASDLVCGCDVRAVPGCRCYNYPSLSRLTASGFRLPR